jgi:hypothetical protein
VRVLAGVHVPEVGDEVTLATDGGYVDTVTIRAVLDGGRKADIEFASGSTLRVPMTMTVLGTVPTVHQYRGTDPDTSREAAESQADGLTHNQIVVLTAIARAGSTGMIDHEHEPINGLDQDTAGKRRGELRDLYGAVTDSGRRRKTPRGRKAIVWVITPIGQRLLTDLQRRGAA